jgi:hypothetical protein
MAKGYKTGGRQAGVPNRATAERQLRAQHGIQAATDDGVLPLDVMLAVMRADPEFGEELKAAHQWINEFWESYIERDH